MAGKFLDRKIQFFEHRRMNLFRLPAFGNGRRRKNWIALRNNNRLDRPLAELLDA
jgi:hypothetical protein